MACVVPLRGVASSAPVMVVLLVSRGQRRAGVSRQPALRTARNEAYGAGYQPTPAWRRLQRLSQDYPSHL